MVDRRDKGSCGREKKAYKRMLQRDTSEEINARRRSEYRTWKKKVKELVDESKMREDEEYVRSWEKLG